MKEEQQTSIEKLTNSALARIKLPIVSTYIIVLIIYNWKILLYLLFKEDAIDSKIDYISVKYSDEYFSNILIPIIIATIYNLLFPILQVGINIFFSNFKKRDRDLVRTEELDDAKHRFELQQNLTGQQSLERLQNNIELLTTENQKLLLDNKNLLERLKEENQRDENSNIFRKTISQKRIKELDTFSNNILNSFNELESQEKSVFLDLINFFDEKNKTIRKDNIENISLNADFSERPLEILKENNILKQSYSSSGYLYKLSDIGYDILEYFKINFSDKLL